VIKRLDQYNFIRYLEIDAMYYHAARQAHKRAIEADNALENHELVWKYIENKEAEILLRYEGDDNALENELAVLYIEMEGFDKVLGKLYAPLLKDVAVVHILCSSSLEAHINKVAEETLTEDDYRDFEKLNIRNKWRDLPARLGFSGFDVGRQPFQGFSKMIDYRNDLIHYKGNKEEWVHGTVPRFISMLGLTLEDSRKSLKAVAEMIRVFSIQRGLIVPVWVDSDENEENYFVPGYR
jgi:hypothetical protein